MRSPSALRQVLGGRKVRLRRKDYAYLFCVDCSDPERDAIERVPVELHHRALLPWLALGEHLPRIPVVCLGSSFQPSASDLLAVPACITGYYDHAKGFAVVRLGPSCRPVDVIFHELTHALIRRTLGGYGVPPAIEEGLALYVQAVCAKASSIDSGSVGIPGVALSVADRLTIPKLLGVDFGRLMKSSLPGYTRAAKQSLYLISWLSVLATRRPQIRGLVSRLRQDEVRTGLGVYLVLLELTGMSGFAMEASFAEFMACPVGFGPANGAGAIIESP